jgi:hypothetical protein
MLNRLNKLTSQAGSALKYGNRQLKSSMNREHPP